MKVEQVQVIEGHILQLFAVHVVIAASEDHQVGAEDAGAVRGTSDGWDAFGRGYFLRD